MGEIHIKIYHLHSKKMAAKITNVVGNFSVFLLLLMGKQKAQKKDWPPSRKKRKEKSIYTVFTLFVKLNQFIMQHTSWQK